MPISTVNISFQKKLLKDIDSVALDEDRSRSELIREATRQYIERKKRWKELIQMTRAHAKKRRLKTQDTAAAIQEYRRQLK